MQFNKTITLFEFIVNSLCPKHSETHMHKRPDHAKQRSSRQVRQRK